MNFLSGYKTYIIVAVGILIYGSEAMGLVGEGTVSKIDELLILLGLGALRLGVAKK